MHRLQRAGLGLLVLLTVLAVPAGAQGAQHVVDDFRDQCPSAQFTTIQSAVDAAAPGDTVSICDGTYREGTGAAGTTALSISKPLTIKGAGARKVFVGPAGDIAAGSPNARDAAGTVVAVNGVGIETDLSGITIFGDGQTIETGLGYYEAKGVVSSVEITDVAGAYGVYATGTGTTATTIADMTIEDSLIEGYGPAGIALDARTAGGQPQPELTPTGTAAQPYGRFALITGSRITGLGNPAVEQDGIQLIGGASTVAVENAITGNGPGDADSAAVEALQHRFSSQTRLNLNTIQGNGFGARQVLASYGPPASALAAPYRGLDVAQNWWADADGPFNAATNPGGGQPVSGTEQGTRPPATTASPPETTRQPIPSSTQDVDYRDFLTEPAPVPSPLTRFEDLAPAAALEAPGDDAVLQPGAATTVTASAADDVGVRSVTFRQGPVVLGVDVTAPYEAAYTPDPALAGTSQSITATVEDSAGQTTAVARSVRIAGPPGATEDAPPTIRITGPTGTIRRGAIGLAADVADDRGIAQVDFLLDGRRVCRDTTAPYSCRVSPRGTDVGRTALIVVVTDTAGQTASAVRTLRIPKIAPRSLSATSRVARGRIVTTGRLRLPSTVSRATGCTGRVTIRYARGGRTIATRRANLSRTCTYRVRARVGRGRIAVRPRYDGNTVLTTRSAPTRRVTVR